MFINDIIKNTNKPKIYGPGTSVMWTDEYISKQLLDVHLNTELDLASRKVTTINKTIDWVLSSTDKKQLNILDLGCGPGLYSEILAGDGHKVTGIDFSKNSIEYASNQAKNKNLDISYICENYCDVNLEENKFDLVLLIFTDFGVLSPVDRSKLLYNVEKCLKLGGVFIFDVLNDKNIEDKISSKNWEVAETGFWRDKPYLALSDSYFYESEKVVLYQHTIIDESNIVEVYRFWTHFFSNSDLSENLKEYSFSNLTFHNDVLPNTDLWNGENVTFCKAIKTL